MAFDFKKVPLGVWLLIGGVTLFIIYFYLIPLIKGIIASSQFKAKELATGEQPTLSDTIAENLADSIFREGSSTFHYSIDKLNGYFSQIKNDADFYLVSEKFGVRSWGLLYLFNKGSGGLVTFMSKMMNQSEDDLQSINDTLAANGVTQKV